MKSNEVIPFLLTSAALLVVAFGIGSYLIRGYMGQSLNCGYFEVTLEPEFGDIQLERGKGELVKVTVTNVGVEDEFRLSVKRPAWAMVKPEKVRLGQGESTELFVYMSPTFDSAGDYGIVLNLASYCTNKDFLINVNVE